MPKQLHAALSVPAHEAVVIENAAHAYGLNSQQKNLLYAIRRQENGGPGKEFGVLHPQAMRFKDNPAMSMKTQAAWAAGTIKKHFDGKNLKNFASRWAPQGASNDPHGMNASWLPNVSKMMDEYNG